MTKPDFKEAHYALSMVERDLNSPQATLRMTLWDAEKLIKDLEKAQDTLINEIAQLNSAKPRTENRWDCNNPLYYYVGGANETVYLQKNAGPPTRLGYRWSNRILDRTLWYNEDEAFRNLRIMLNESISDGEIRRQIRKVIPEDKNNREE